MFGLGKKRTRLGNFIDRHKATLTQGKLATGSGLSRDQISRLCDGEKNIAPNESTQTKIVSALRKFGFDVTPRDFW